MEMTDPQQLRRLLEGSSEVRPPVTTPRGLGYVAR
jgi:hypothetical protein